MEFMLTVSLLVSLLVSWLVERVEKYNSIIQNDSTEN